MHEGEATIIRRGDNSHVELILKAIDSDKSVRFLYKGVEFRVNAP